MKKIWILLIISILLLTACVSILLLTACDKKIEYDEWKDTIVSYGDGTYQLIHQRVDNQSVEVLTNCKHNQCVMTDVKKHIKENDYAYFVGYYYNQKVFCKLNITDNMLFYFAEDNDEELIMVYINGMLADKQIEIYKSLDDFSQEDRSVFDSMN